MSGQPGGSPGPEGGQLGGELEEEQVGKTWGKGEEDGEWSAATQRKWGCGVTGMSPLDPEVPLPSQLLLGSVQTLRKESCMS